MYSRSMDSIAIMMVAFKIWHKWLKQQQINNSMVRPRALQRTCVARALHLYLYSGTPLL